MSSEARQWAFDQDIKPSSVKFVLVTLGDIAQGPEVWPSVALLAEKTGQDRKTVMAALDKLEAMGYLADTKKRVGNTGQIKVYRFNFARSNSTENGTVQVEETVPDFPINSTVFPDNSTVFPPKSTENGTRNREEPLGTVREPKDIPATPAKKRKKTLLPDGFGISERVKRWAVEKGHQRLEDRLEHFVGAAKARGYEYADWDEAFMNAVRDDWAKFNGQPARASPPKQSRHSGFDKMDYDEGVTADGRIA